MVRKRAKIADIAAEAGVSVATVSKVLNGRTDVSDGTRARVEAALLSNRYERRRSHRHGGVGLIGLVVDELDSSWSIEIIRGVEEVCYEAGLGMALSAVHGRSPAARDWLENLAARRSDGVVLVVTGLTASDRARLDALGLRFVVVDPVGEADSEVPAVGATNWAGGISATEHLISLGHTRVAHIGGPPGLLSSRARADGFRAAMERARVPVRDGYVRHAELTDRGGYAEAAALLDLPEPPTAVFAAGDQQALGVYEAMRERSLRVPHDVSVVGFDDVPIAKWVNPALTTVRQPIAGMAATATRVLLRLIAGEPVDAPRVELATRLVVRDSTAKVSRDIDGERAAAGAR
ncbi:LacI family DNA-binding transcriptional regulator [Spirillospora sp. NPDC047279]|uniref:LacI family DNA-binding transcriptional regulator n=1 Tax=Spirillospora sp. NPDC047279 TaxID=3155478 RepID=UPI0033EB2B77